MDDEDVKFGFDSNTRIVVDRFTTMTMNDLYLKKTHPSIPSIDVNDFSKFGNRNDYSVTKSEDSIILEIKLSNKHELICSYFGVEFLISDGSHWQARNLEIGMELLTVDYSNGVYKVDKNNQLKIIDFGETMYSGGIDVYNIENFSGDTNFLISVDDKKKLAVCGFNKFYEWMKDDDI